MNPLQRALIEKAGHDNGFEHVLTSGANLVTLASARHPTRSSVSLESGSYQVRFAAASATFLTELSRSFSQLSGSPFEITVSNEAFLAALLRRAAGLARALPSQAENDYQRAVASELALLPASLAGTEVERLVRQRVGQSKFRDAMLDYWGGACAVTGVSVPEVLRASHAKPWAECATDAERLDVFNGFLLCANLDALFDRYLISFDLQGRLLIAPALAGRDLLPLGIGTEMRLRWLNPLHGRYLETHRIRFLGLQA